MAKIYFIGAGPGDPELITIKGQRIIAEADVIIYAGSLVNPETSMFLMYTPFAIVVLFSVIIENVP